MGIHLFQTWLKKKANLKIWQVLNPKRDDSAGDDVKSPEMQRIVVDAKNICYLIMEDNWRQDILFFNTKRLRDAIIRFVQRFQRCGMELVCFLDSWYVPEKLSEATRRAAKKIEAQNSLCEVLEKCRNGSKRKVSKKKLMSLVINSVDWKLALPHALMEAGCSVFFTKVESDRTMAKYVVANPERVFALMSNDTDFFGFQLPPNVYIIREKVTFLKDGRISLNCYSPADVWATLALDFHQRLRLIALAGNDFVNAAKPKRPIDELARRVKNSCSKKNAKIRKLEAFYMIKASETWEADIAGRTYLEAWLNEIKLTRHTVFSSETGNVSQTQSYDLLEECRKQLYYMMGLTSVQETWLVPEQELGQRTVCEASAVPWINNHLSGIAQGNADIYQIFEASCSIFVDVTPQSSKKKAQVYVKIIRGQFRLLRKQTELGRLDKSFLDAVKNLTKTSVPRPCDMSAITLFKNVVQLVCALLEMPRIPCLFDWLDGSLFHFGVQCTKEFNNWLRQYDLEAVDGVGKKWKARPVDVKRIWTGPQKRNQKKNVRQRNVGQKHNSLRRKYQAWQREDSQRFGRVVSETEDYGDEDWSSGWDSDAEYDVIQDNFEEQFDQRNYKKAKSRNTRQALRDFSRY